MTRHKLSVRELRETDIDLITDYWLDADDAFLTGMGVDLSKMPDREEWARILAEQLDQTYEEKRSYCIIWLVDENPVGHCNVNKIKFGEEAYMHMHLWKADKRQKGLGAAMVKKALPYFFNNLQLKALYCEPYTFNPAPNKTMEKLGFTFVKEHITIPGTLNFEQPAKLWKLDYNNYCNLK